MNIRISDLFGWSSKASLRWNVKVKEEITRQIDEVRAAQIEEKKLFDRAECDTNGDRKNANRPRIQKAGE